MAETDGSPAGSVDQIIEIVPSTVDGELVFEVPDVEAPEGQDWRVRWKFKARYDQDYYVVGIGRASRDELWFKGVRIANRRLVATFRGSSVNREYILVVRDMNTGLLHFPNGTGVPVAGAQEPNPRPKVKVGG